MLLLLLLTFTISIGFTYTMSYLDLELSKQTRRGFTRMRLQNQRIYYKSIADGYTK